jgi:hypothetical protein
VFADLNCFLPLVQQNDAEHVHVVQLCALIIQVLQTSAESVLGAIRAVHGLMQPRRLVDSCLSFFNATLCLAEHMEHHSAMVA